MTQVLDPTHRTHRLIGQWRLLLGFCPRCNSDAPHVYDCPVCIGTPPGFPPSLGTKAYWWWRWMKGDGDG